jgi:hypothetical protein
MSQDVLPDSRLLDPKATVMTDWPVLDNGVIRTIRLELEPIFCASCGRPNGYVPKDVLSWVCWLCRECSAKYGEDASHMLASDELFWADVASEMLDRFGHVLNQAELEALAAARQLGRNLELLERESPYRDSLS